MNVERSARQTRRGKSSVNRRKTGKGRKRTPWTRTPKPEQLRPEENGEEHQVGVIDVEHEANDRPSQGHCDKDADPP